MKKNYDTPSMQVFPVSVADELASVSGLYDENDRMDGTDFYGKETVAPWPGM